MPEVVILTREWNLQQIRQKNHARNEKREAKTYWVSDRNFLLALFLFLRRFFEELGPTPKASGKTAGTNSIGRLTAWDEVCALISCVDGSGFGIFCSWRTCVPDEAPGLATCTLTLWGMALIVAWLGLFTLCNAA